jgi:hypothetical protein
MCLFLTGGITEVLKEKAFDRRLGQEIEDNREEDYVCGLSKQKQLLKLY